MSKNGNPLWQTAEWKKRQGPIARKMALAYWAQPRCGAKAKKHGGPCRMPALANGRCRFHGGLTPKGSEWHRPVFKAGRTSSGQDRLERKLYDLERARKKRDKRVAAMTPDERAAYLKWHQARQPSASARVSYRLRRQQSQEVQALLMPDTGVSGQKWARLEAQIRSLEAQVAILAAESETAQAPALDLSNDLGGIFE